MNRSVTAYISHSDRGSYIVPDKEFKALNPQHTYKASCGFAFTLEVFSSEGECIGWIDISVLGYNSVKDWMMAVVACDNSYVAAYEDK